MCKELWGEILFFRGECVLNLARRDVPDLDHAVSPACGERFAVPAESIDWAGTVILEDVLLLVGFQIPQHRAVVMIKDHEKAVVRAEAVVWLGPVHCEGVHLHFSFRYSRVPHSCLVLGPRSIGHRG